MTEHRATPRVPLELKTGYARLGAPSARLRGAFTRDVSRGGFLIATPSYEPFAGDIRGEFRLPGQETPVPFEARVVWSRVTGAVRQSGCSFTRLDAPGRRRLEELLGGVWTQMLTVY